LRREAAHADHLEELPDTTRNLILDVEAERKRRIRRLKAEHVERWQGRGGNITPSFNSEFMEIEQGSLRIRLCQPLLSLAYQCETFCVIGCYGIEALDICADTVLSWAQRAGIDEARAALKQIDNIINAAMDYQQLGTVAVRELGFGSDPRVVAAYFDMLRELIEQAIEQIDYPPKRQGRRREKRLERRAARRAGQDQ
jgi:hypothetical protein